MPVSTGNRDDLRMQLTMVITLLIIENGSDRLQHFFISKPGALSIFDLTSRLMRIVD